MLLPHCVVEPYRVSEMPTLHNRFARYSKFFSHFFQDSWTELFIRLRLSRDLVPANIVLGAQWGDEGKGKAIDQLAPNSTWAVRFQGGNIT